MTVILLVVSNSKINIFTIGLFIASKMTIIKNLLTPQSQYQTLKY